ncbi:MAG: 2-succinyl-5-enolpyruvyl-6-hydroxy-3-cyclohexene-1-carboxylate synthase [Winogradskyella sp.]
MLYSKIPLAQTITSLCKMHRIKHIVISPGSRNAPLTIGFTHNDFFKCYSIVDERCAAFFALGIAQQLQEPVAVVCTSGSALLNYYPAIAEAFYSCIPLVVLSADRPECLIDIGDGQTIKQKNVYGEHVLYNANLKLDLKNENEISIEDELSLVNDLENKFERFLALQHDIQSYNETEIHTALSVSKINSAPVHINVPFNEPLYETVNEPSICPKPLGIQNKNKAVNNSEIKDCVAIWQHTKRKLILVGVLQPHSIEEKWLQQLADDDSVLVFTETTSNIHHPNFFPGIDKIIAPLETIDFKALQPKILLTFGGLVVSKKIKVFLRQYNPEQHWHIGLEKANDTFFCLNKHIKLSPNMFLSKFLPQLTHKITSDYKTKWLAVKTQRCYKHNAYLETIPFSDFTVFNSVLQSLPAQSQLQVGNSSAIRYTQLFKMPKTVAVFCNRGTSGIDGSTSTAIGAAVATKKRVTFITGDLSFFYDSNALWNDYIPNNFRIILVNNNGGGIFRILPGRKHTKNFKTYFETKHKLTAKQLCKMYGFEYVNVESDAALKNALNTFYEASNQPKLLEVFTPSDLNDTILLAYFKSIK